MTVHWSWRGILILLVGSLFYLYEFFLRVSPSVLSQEMMAHFHLTAGPFSLMAAFFFFAYAPMQIPSGLLGDLFGPRKILTLMTLLCALSCALFVHTNDFLLASSARALMGFSASFAYLAPLILASRWFHAKYFAMITGFIQAMGCLGALLGTAPIARLAHNIGWQTTLTYAGYFGLGLSGLTYLIVRDKQALYPTTASWAQLKKTLSAVIHTHQTWWIALVGFACWAPMSVFTELWGPAFLVQAEHLTITQAAAQTSWVWWGVACGGPVLGLLSQYTQRRCLWLGLGLSLSLICSIWIIYTPPLTPILLSCLLFGLGFGCSAQAVSFGLVRDNNALIHSGTAVGFNNMAVILGGILLQPLTGYLLDLFWTGEHIHSSHIYSIHAYHISFLLIPISILIGLFSLIFYVKETHCQSIQEPI